MSRRCRTKNSRIRSSQTGTAQTKTVQNRTAATRIIQRRIFRWRTRNYPSLLAFAHSKAEQDGLSLRPALGSPVCDTKRPAASTHSPRTYSRSRQICGNHHSHAKATLGRQI